MNKIKTTVLVIFTLILAGIHSLVPLNIGFILVKIWTPLTNLGDKILMLAGLPIGLTWAGAVFYLYLNRTRLYKNKIVKSAHYILLLSPVLIGQSLMLFNYLKTAFAPDNYPNITDGLEGIEILFVSVASVPVFLLTFTVHILLYPKLNKLNKFIHFIVFGLVIAFPIVTTELVVNIDWKNTNNGLKNHTVPKCEKIEEARGPCNFSHPGNYSVGFCDYRRYGRSRGGRTSIKLRVSDTRLKYNNEFQVYISSNTQNITPLDYNKTILENTPVSNKEYEISWDLNDFNKDTKIIAVSEPTTEYWDEFTIKCENEECQLTKRCSLKYSKYDIKSKTIEITKAN